MVELSQVTYRYPRSAEPVLRDLNLTIPEGQFCAVVGANGAGKSTLCYTLTGFVPHFYKGRLDGAVYLDQRLVAETPLAELAGEAGLVFANPFNQITGARFTVREEIAFGLENLGVAREEILRRIEAVMDLLELSDLADRPPLDLSGGQQQRLALASVIVMEPRLLVLDEPTSQLDPLSTFEVFSALESLTEQQTMTIVLVTHKLEWAAVFADRVIVLDGGRIAADGPPREVLASDGLADFGLRPTRYTEVARLARQEQLVAPERPLPVTLAQTVEFLS